MAPRVDMEAVTLMALEAFWAHWPLPLHRAQVSQRHYCVLHTPWRVYAWILIKDGHGSLPTS